MELADISDLLDESHFPHILCAGCGHGIALRAALQAIRRLALSPEKMVIVGGIGCSSRVVGYVRMDSVHTTHGRAIAFATGIKLARPDLKVLVIAGDGDLAAIGGNHLIHAARRNIGLTVLCFNNEIYGMTSGQYSPTTPPGSMSATSPYGAMERTFDLCRLVEAAGATYVARSTVNDVFMLSDFIGRALTHEGFSFVDVVSPCPTYFGRQNRLGDPVKLYESVKEKTIRAKAAGKMSAEDLEGKVVVGEFVRKDLPEYTSEYRRLVVAKAVAK